MMMGIIGGESTTATAASVTNTDFAADATDLTTYTFSAKSLGTAASDRRIIVVVGGTATAARTISSVTIAGTSATSVVSTTDNDGVGFTRIGIFIADVPTGTTGDVVVTFSGGMVAAFCGVFRAVGLNSATATATNSSIANPLTATLDIQAGGIAVGGAGNFRNGGGGTPTFSWTNLTEKYDQAVEAGFEGHTGACDNFATAQTALSITCTPSAGTEETMVLAAWR